MEIENEESKTVSYKKDNESQVERTKPTLLLQIVLVLQISYYYYWNNIFLWRTYCLKMYSLYFKFDWYNLQYSYRPHVC
jgi:hypothetical protein